MGPAFFIDHLQPELVPIEWVAFAITLVLSCFPLVVYTFDVRNAVRAQGFLEDTDLRVLLKSFRTETRHRQVAGKAMTRSSTRLKSATKRRNSSDPRYALRGKGAEDNGSRGVVPGTFTRSARGSRKRGINPISGWGTRLDDIRLALCCLPRTAGIYCLGMP